MKMDKSILTVKRSILIAVRTRQPSKNAGRVGWREMFGYATDLRSKTQGRGLYTMQSDHFEEVPKSVSEEIIAKRRG